MDSLYICNGQAEHVIYKPSGYYIVSLLILDKGSLWRYAQSAVHSRVVAGAVLVPLTPYTEQCLRQQCLLQRW